MRTPMPVNALPSRIANPSKWRLSRLKTLRPVTGLGARSSQKDIIVNVRFWDRPRATLVADMGRFRLS